MSFEWVKCLQKGDYPDFEALLTGKAGIVLS